MADNRGYLGAEDGHLGDWVPHQQKCKCADCRLDRLQSSYDKLKRDNKALLEALKLHHEWCIKNQSDYHANGADAVAFRATAQAIAQAEVFNDH